MSPSSGAARSATARVVLARTSEPPCFSVMPMPTVRPALSAIGASTGSYARDASRGSQRAATSGSTASAGAAA